MVAEAERTPGRWGATLPDVDVLQRLSLGDSGALETLMERYTGKAYRLAFGITRDPSDAEEVVQDVFVTILRKHSTFEGRSARGSWIYRITTNLALNKRRGKRAEVEVSLEEHLPTFESDGHRAGDRAMLLADWSQAPDRELASAESQRVLQRALEALPPLYRAILVMRDVEELSNEETAEVLGETVGAVKSRLHRARMALREQLTRHFAGSPR